MPSQSRAMQQVDPATQQMMQQQEYQQQVAARAKDYEVHESSASASAQAGLNLNIFAALSGSMFSRSKKTTKTAADGSSESVEHRDTAAVAHGKGHGNLQIMGQGNATAKTRDVVAKGVEGQKSVEKKRVDHLGIEG